MAASKGKSGTMAADNSSLQRLKALSTLPDLDSQLQEAQKLCNHPARAEMILKWLLESMKNVASVRSDRRSWGLLASASRLLQPARLATLLGSVNLLKIVQDSFAEGGKPKPKLFRSIASTLSLLLEMAAGEKGAPLQAYLSAGATDAASFVAAWLLESRKVSDHEALEPALKIWHLRKRSSDENEAFAKHCLGVVGESIGILGNMNETVFRTPEEGLSIKRKRPGSDAVRPQLKELESLLAKHVFLPARTAFFDAQQPRKDSRKQVTRSEALELSKRLVSLKRLDSASSLDRLFDIALRCSPAITPRQRLKEGPWVEALFSALVDAAPDVDEQDFHHMLQMMVTVVRQRQALLSTGFLRKLVAEHAKYDDEQRIDWELIREVIKLDATVYTTVHGARAFFDDVSSAMLAPVNQRDLEDEEAQSDPGRLANTWQNDIVIPIMQAFAQNRDILGFVGLWEEQLLRPWPDMILPVWFELGDAFGELVEEYLTEQEIKDLMDKHGKVLMAKFGEEGHEKLSAALSKITASTTILDAVLSGVRTPELLDSLWPQLDQLFKGLILASEKHSVVKIAKAADSAPCPHLWALLEKLLTLWFPLWATEHASEESIETWIPRESNYEFTIEADLGLEKFKTPLDQWTAIAFTSKLIAPVEQLLKTIGEDRKASVLARDAAACAESWLLTFCSVTHSYANRGLNRELFNGISKEMSIDRLGALLRHPKAFGALEEDNRNDLLILKWLGDAARDQIALGQRDLVMSRIRGIIDTAMAKCQPAVIEQIACITLTFLESHDRTHEIHLSDSPTKVATLRLGLDILLELPPTALSMSQRERILDAVASLEHSQMNGEEILEPRLLVMTKLLELPCPGAKILTDSTTLWRLANPEYQRGDNAQWRKYHATAKVEQLLERLTGLVMKQLLAAQTQDQPAAMITALYEVAFSSIEHISTYVKHGRAPRLLYIIMPLLSSMPRLRENISTRCIDQAALQAYIDGLTQSAEKALGRKEFDNDLSAQAELRVILDALLHVPTTMLTGDTTQQLKILAQRTLQSLDSRYKPDPEKEPLAGARKSLFVLGFKALCLKGLDSTSLEYAAQVAMSVLDQELEPQDHVMFYEVLESALRDSTSQSRLHFVRHFLQASHSNHGIRLLRTTLSSLMREDFDNETAVSEVGTAQAIFGEVLAMVKKAEKLALTRAACDCVITVLREKPFMTNQHTIEATVATLKHLTQHGAHISILYLDICRVVTALLQQHRSRLKDRLNIVVDLLQSLISCFFAKKSASQRLTPRHAKMLARILQLLCNPPQRNSRAGKSDLVDEARKAQAHIGQYVQYVLHHYCAQVLTGTHAEGVREALLPGLWAMIEAIEVNDADGIKSLSAAMNNSERAVLRTLYEDYKTFGKWHGG